MFSTNSIQVIQILITFPFLVNKVAFSNIETKTYNKNMHMHVKYAFKIYIFTKRKKKSGIRFRNVKNDLAYTVYFLLNENILLFCFVLCQVILEKINIKFEQEEECPHHY